MASLQCEVSTLRQRRRLKKLAKQARKSIAFKNNDLTTLKEQKTTVNVSVTTDIKVEASPPLSSTPTTITAVPPYHPPSNRHEPSPRSKRIATYNSSEQATSDKYRGETKTAAAAARLHTSNTFNTSNMQSRKDNNDTTTQAREQHSTRCKLVYTGSFGVGYTCSVCNVFREWRKVYICTGAPELETGLGRHFAVRREQKYLQFVDGTRVPSLSPLPTELLENILGFFNFREMCKFETTCTDWYRISHHPQFAKGMANRDRKNFESLSKDNVNISCGSPSRSNPNRMMSFVDVVHAAVRSARNACRTIALERETPQRIVMYASRDVRRNQIFRAKLAECSNNWISFLLDELSRLCKDNDYRRDHPAFLAKLKFLDKELCRRKTGRAAASKLGYVDWLEEMRRKIALAMRAGQKPRMGEAKIRNLVCNWRK